MAIEFHFAESRYDRLPAMAAELTSRQVAVITTTDIASTIAAKKATTTIPIVFTFGADPVQLGLVAILNRPAGRSGRLAACGTRATTRARAAGRGTAGKRCRE